MPPWGLWPAAFIGVAWFDQSLTGRPILSRFSRGILVGLSWALPSTFWMVDLTPPGWLIAAFLHSGFIGLAAVLVPPFRGRRLGLIGTICLAEFVRWKIPFGGIPLASIPIGQVSGPLASIVRLAGPLLLVALVVAIGCSLSSLFDRLDKKSIQYLHTMPYQKQSNSDMIGIRTDKYKYFRFARNPDENVHLYDLENDPFENTNIAKGNEKLISEFETKISEIEKNEVSNDDELSEEEIEYELKKMGYV